MGRRIGILTGGGDVPGLNSVIKSVVYRASEYGDEVLGIRRGWQGLTHMRGGADATYLLPLDRANTRTIDRTGGTMLHTTRTNPAKMPEDRLPEWLSAANRAKLATGADTYDLTPLVLENIERLGLDCLVTIGGDDTLSFSRVLMTSGVDIVAVPKTMDNDVQGTEYCIGFSTAITRANELIDHQRTTLGSHERIGVFRIFGRDAGFSALHSAYVTSGRCLIPEYAFDLDHLVELMVEDRENNPSGYAFVIAAEGAMWRGGSLEEYGPADAFGHRRKANIAEMLAAEIRARTGRETLASELTYELRSGVPDALDQTIAVTFANIAVELIRDRAFGRMVAVQGGNFVHTTLPDPARGARRVDVATQYNVDRLRPQYAGRLGASIFLT